MRAALLLPLLACDPAVEGACAVDPDWAGYDLEVLLLDGGCSVHPDYPEGAVCWAPDLGADVLGTLISESLPLHATDLDSSLESAVRPDGSVFGVVPDVPRPG